MDQRNLLKDKPSRLKILDKKLYDEFTIIWNTDDLKRFKPTPAEEARWGLAVIEDSLWETIPKVYRRLNSIFIKNINKGLPKNFNPIEFGSWMGGDRDGNPNVTALVTREVILLSRWEAAKLYEKTLTKIRFSRRILGFHYFPCRDALTHIQLRWWYDVSSGR